MPHPGEAAGTDEASAVSLEAVHEKTGQRDPGSSGGERFLAVS
jgi:hypothetical protein